MPRPPRVVVPGALYHVVARGNRRETVFRVDQDYRVYLARIARYRERYGPEVHAYCLMPNHVHLFVRAGHIPLARFMQGLQQSYTQYFNRRYETTGHVFQGRYRAILCADDRYAIALVRYIHRNPVEAGLVQSLDDYPYSSHRLYLEGRRTPTADPTALLRVLGGPGGYRALADGASPPGPADHARLHAQDQRPATPEPAPEPSEAIEDALERLASRAGASARLLRGADRTWAVARLRAHAMEALVRRGYPIQVVARLFGRSPGTVSVAVGRVTRDRNSKIVGA